MVVISLWMLGLLIASGCVSTSEESKPFEPYYQPLDKDFEKGSENKRLDPNQVPRTIDGETQGEQAPCQPQARAVVDGRTGLVRRLRPGVHCQDRESGVGVSGGLGY